ncbi:MAG TPA: hypothetical protein VLJ42_03325 [Solirubrobacteraceae bacterium]|nr:hypothetical protein [Solirubrobacteraceae bacterium]
MAALSALILLALALAPAAPAADSSSSESPLNDQGSSPNYRSLITSVTPRQPGLSLQVLQFSDRLQLINRSGQTVTVAGYQGEPYARVLGNGAVELNTRSPAYYLNQSFYGNITVPASASAKAAPRWRVVDRTGQLQWHDHRIHWMSPVLPPQVKDKRKRTLIFNWTVPLQVGASKGAVSGRLLWAPQSSSAPTGAIVALVVLVLLALALVLVVRRRRARIPPREAW